MILSSAMSCRTMDDVSPELKAFLDFVKGISSDDPFIRKLDARVREAKQNSELRRDFIMMTMWEQGKFEEGREEGRVEGRVEGRAEGVQQAQEGFVMKMLQAGKLALREIAEYSGLTLAQVRTIQKSMA